MSLITLFFFIIALIYFALVLWFTGGWMKLVVPRKLSVFKTKVTLIIAARNEEENIVNCLEDVSAQEYPADLLEVLIADDGSTDNTSHIIESYILTHKGIQIRLLKNPGLKISFAGKKQAIEYAIGQSTGDLIITSDADTHFGPSWISSMAGFYEQYHPKMILGPVAFYQEDTVFERMQSLEFLGLMGITGGSCQVGMPVMCNGANLAYERKAFEAVGGYHDNLEYRSGDDMFLMLKIRKHFGAGSVTFLKSAEAIVRTKAKSSFREFVHQRVRWVSKNKGIKDIRMLFVAIVTFLFNFPIFSGTIATVFHPGFFFLPLILIISKMVIEFPLIFMTSRWFGKTRFLIHYPAAQVLNIFYVVIIGFFGNFLSFSWKGRNKRS